MSSNLAVMFLAGDFALFQHNRCAEEHTDETEDGKREERNHKDGHKSLLSGILRLQTRAGGDGCHGLL